MPLCRTRMEQYTKHPTLVQVRVEGIILYTDKHQVNANYQ